MILSVLALGTSAALAAAQSTGAQYTFLPQTKGVQNATHLAPLPSAYDLGPSQSLQSGQETNSWWSSHYLTGNNGHQYLVLSHLLALAGQNLSVHRGSVYDITADSFNQFTTISTFDAYQAIANGTEFGFIGGDYGMAPVGDDPVGTINTYSNNDGCSFNLTYDLSAPVIMDGGDGTFSWENRISVAEWSMPNGVTTGSLTVNNETVEVDSSNSFTWYDRQWQIGSATNWTWFELHMTPNDNKPVGSTKMSIWFYPSGYGDTKGFATVGDSSGVLQVIPGSFTPLSRTWTSPVTNNTYHQSWNVELVDGTSLYINTTSGDQELADANAVFSNYEGFVTVRGSNADNTKFDGFGLVEIQPVSKNS